MAILVRKKIVGITQNFKMYGIMLNVTQQRIYWIELKYYGGKIFWKKNSSGQKTGSVKHSRIGDNKNK